jgi:hypothetical protein
MVESEVDIYNLSSEERKQTLRVSLINNEQISMIIVNLSTEQRYTALVSLTELRKLCGVFESTETPKEALSIIKDVIESGGIALTEDLEINVIELKFNINTNQGEMSFDINLNLEKPNENEKPQENVKQSEKPNENGNEKKDGEEDVQVLQPIFDYNGNREAESKYGKQTKDTTEFVKPIVQSNIKPPVLELEIIEPILQVHYPDGTTKSTALPPRIQGPGGENITDEQLKTIQEQMDNNDTIKNFSPLKELLKNRSSSVAKGNISHFSTQTTPYPYTNNIARVNPMNNNNVVRPANQATQTQMYQNNVGANTGINQNNMNNDFNKTTSGYSTLTMQNRPYGLNNNSNYIAQLPKTTIFNNNLNRTNVFKNNQGKMIERRPRMINNPRDAARSASTPHENFAKFNQNQNYQQNNPYQTSQNQLNDGAEKYPYDRNTQRTRRNNINTVQNLNTERIPQNQLRQNPNFNAINPNNLQQIRINQPHNNNLAKIELQQQRLKEVQEKLALIQKQQQKLQERQRELALQHQQNQNKKNRAKMGQNLQNSRANSNYPPQGLQQQQTNQNQNPPIIRKALSQSINDNQLNFQSQNIQQQYNQISQPPMPNNPIRQTNSLTNIQKFQTQTSQDIKQTKTQTLGYKTQTSTPIPSSLESKNINQQLLSFAQMASMQNEANPQYNNMQAITLEQQHQELPHTEETEEIREYQPQEMQENEYTEVSEQQGQGYGQIRQLSGQDDMSIEALFFTEDGRVIFRNGLLRGIIHTYAEIDEVVGKIQDTLLKGVKFTLVYKAFDVWDRSKTFHEKCDGLKMSLVLIETDKDVRFGGFTTKSWEGNCVKKIDNKAFVFSLDKNKIYDVIENEPAIGCYPKFGPVFFGCQIRIYDEFFTKGGTTCHRGLNYRTTEDYELNNGEQAFLIKDIEVYRIDTMDIE